VRQGPLIIGACAVGLASCGGGDSGNGGDAEARQVVTQFVNTNDCDLASDSFIVQGEPVAADVAAARKACERSEHDSEGIRKGDYKVSAVQTDGDQGTVALALNTGESRVYSVVREGGEWRVDDYKDKPSTAKHRIGKTVPFADNYELDGVELDVRLNVTALSFTKARPPAYVFDPKPGSTWWRLQARVASDSSGEVQVGTGDFVVRDQQGQSFEGAADYPPPLANVSRGVAPKETVKGYVSFNLPKRSRPTELLFKPPVSENKRITWIVR
jgi:hypothetical protein